MIQYNKACVLIGLSCVMIPVSSGHAGSKQAKDAFLEKAIEETAKLSPPVTASPDPLPVSEETVISSPPVLYTASERGIMFGSFLIHPVLSLIETYDSNILAAETQEDEGFITIVKPSVQAELQNSKSDLMFEASYDWNFYADDSDETHGNLKSRLSGALVLSDMVSIPFELGYKDVHQARAENLTSQRSEEILSVQTWHGIGGVEFRPSRLSLALLGGYQDEQFEDGVLQGTNTAFIRSDSDRNTANGDVRLGYNVTDNTEVFVQTGYQHREYDDLAYVGTTFSGVDRSSDQWSAMIGLNLTYNDVEALIGIGYANRDYDDNAVDDVQDVIVTTKLDWNINERMHLSFDGDRSIYEDDDIVQAIIRSKGQLRLEDKFSDRWTFGADAGYEILDFKASSRDDGIYHLGADAHYQLTDYLSLGADYGVSKRESSAANNSFDKHVIMLRVAGAL